MAVLPADLEQCYCNGGADFVKVGQRGSLRRPPYSTVCAL